MSLYQKIVGNILLLLSVSISVFGQNEDTDSELQDTEVVIQKDRKIELNKETKLYEFIKWQPQQATYKSNNEGKYEVFNYELSKEEEIYVAATPPSSAIGDTYLQYLKAGIGNYLSPILDVNLVTPADVDQAIRFNYKHLSFGRGEVDDRNSASSTNELALDGYKIWDRVKTTANVGFRSDTNYYYGYEDDEAPQDRADIKKNNRFFDAGLLVEDNDHEDDWSYEIGVQYKRFGDNYSNAENTLEITGDISYLENYHVKADVAVSSLSNTINSRSYYAITPYYSHELSGVNIDAGLSISGQNGQTGNLTQFKAFPYLGATYDLNNAYQAFLTLDGGYEFNTLYVFSDVIPYLNSTALIENTENRLLLHGGVRGNINDQWYTEVKLGVKSLRNLPVYINNNANQTMLDIAYVDNTTTVTTIGVTSQYYLDDANDFLFSLEYNNYASGTIKPYHLPVLTLNLRGHHEFYEDWSVQWQYQLLSGITAYDSDSDTNVDMDAIHQLDLSVHYQIRERLGAFISGENIVGKSYTRYYLYPQRRLQIKAGITYRF